MAIKGTMGEIKFEIHEPERGQRMVVIRANGIETATHLTNREYNAMTLKGFESWLKHVAA